MKIIRWLLSHSFLILLIVVVIYGYMFWGNLLGKETPAGKAVAYLSGEFVVVKDFVNAVKAKQARLNGENPPETTAQISGQTSSQAPGHTSAQQAIVKEPTIADNDVAPQQAEPVTSKTVLRKETNHYAAQQVDQQPLQQQDPVSDKQPVDNNDIQDNLSKAQAVTAANDAESKTESVAKNQPVRIDAQAENPADSNAVGQSADIDSSAKETVALINVDQNGGSQDQSNPEQAKGDQGQVGNDQSSAEQAFVSLEIEKQLDNVDKQGRVIDESKKVNEIEVDWVIARKSFYQRNYDLSEKSYLKVINNTEDNFDAYGELGNVYFNQGKNEQAASAYFEAAAILVRKGQVNRARSLMGLLRHLDKSKAGELQQLINSTQS